ncbi:MAG TPA: DUF2934 domain-containing protein [Terriglobales bacterium]|nr:DUF2934 domain-containing protein [Terriglobales bacterium]
MADIRVTSTTEKKSGAAKGAAKSVSAKSESKKTSATTERKPITKPSTVKAPPRRTVTPEERWRMVAEAAYLRAEKRGFIGGNPTDDWLAAEAEIDKLLSQT